MSAHHTPSFDYAYGFDFLDEVHNFFPEFLYDEELFDNDMAGFFRYRVANLFPRAYTRHQHMYALYNREQGRAAFEEYMRLRHEPPNAAAAWPPPPPPHQQQHQQQPQQPQTPHTTRPSTPPGIREISGSQPPLYTLYPTLQTPPAPRRRINVDAPALTRADNAGEPFVGSTGPSRLFQSLFDNPNMTTLTAEFTEDRGGALRLMDMLFGNFVGVDVVVAPTGAQIEAASELQTNPPEDSVCSICQEGASEAVEDVEWRVLRCDHAFHRPCIDAWLQSHVRCPMCRRDVRTMGAAASAASVPSTITSTLRVVTEPSDS